METLRFATEDQSDLLSELAYRSEAYWGYDEAYMNRFRLFYNVGKDFISHNTVCVLEGGSDIIGFFGLSEKTEEWQLEYFYITASHIGKGFGCRLWNMLIQKCREMDISCFEFVTSPQAVPFYEKMGAETIGYVESLLMRGRMIPKLRYAIPE